MTLMRNRSRRSGIAAVLLSGALVLVSADGADAQTAVTSSPVGVVSAPLLKGQSSGALPLTLPDVVVGVVQANTGANVVLPPTAGSALALLDPARAYHVEVLTGTLEGERLDVDVPSTVAAGGSTVVLSLGTGSRSTVPSLSAGALVGARCALRPHVTLADLPEMVVPALRGHDTPGLAEGVWLLEKEELRFYHLKGDQASWGSPGSKADARGKVIPPDMSLLFDVRAAGKRFVHAGAVRVNDFRKNLSAGAQPFATGFPADLTPAQARAFADPGAPAAHRWTGSDTPAKADTFRLVLSDKSEVRVFLAGDGTTWRTRQDPADLAHTPILGALGMVVVERRNPDPGYRIPPPFDP
jgi:hypothetical protein